MSGARPRRARKAPERFGSLVDPTQGEVEALLASDASDGEAQRPAKRCRRAPAARSDEESTEEEDAAASGSDSDGGGSSEEEGEEGEGRLGAKRGRRGTAAAKLPALHVPAPPREPRSRGDMMSLLFACPALIDSLLEPDGLRTISLVARDAAQLAAALGARPADMAGLWQQLARRCQPGFAGSPEEALAVVRRACRADPSRTQKLNTKTAETQYRVTRGELKGLPYSLRHSDSFWSDSVKMYSKLDVLAIAHRKWGNMQVLERQLQLAADRKLAAKEKRESMKDRRSKEISKLLSKAGLEGPASRRHSREGRRRIKDYVKKGEGKPADIVAAMKKEAEVEGARAERQRQMHQKLQEEGMLDDQYSGAILAWVMGRSEHQTAEEAVEAAKAAKAAADARRAAVIAALVGEGLDAFVPENNPDYGGYLPSRVPGLDAYVDRGEGSHEAVLEAARELRAAAQAREQRREAATQALIAEGLQQSVGHGLPGWHSWVESGAGSIDALLAAAREKQQAAQAVEARRARIHELLAAEGLQEYSQSGAALRYIHNNEGSEEAVVEAARVAAAEAAARAQRRATLEAALQGVGIGFHAISYLPAVRFYLEGHDGGTLEAALAAARQLHEQRLARDARSAALAAAFESAGLQLATWRYRLPGVESFLASGQGSAESLVAQAQEAAAAQGPAVHGYVV